MCKYRCVLAFCLTVKWEQIRYYRLQVHQFCIKISENRSKGFEFQICHKLVIEGDVTLSNNIFYNARVKKRNSEKFNSSVAEERCLKIILLVSKGGVYAGRNSTPCYPDQTVHY